MELFRDTVFESVLEKMGEQFDSHDFIFEMMRHFPREYTYSLYECRRSKDPIQTLHAKIGRKLLEFDSSTLPSGIYTLHVQEGARSYSEKLMVR